MKHPWVILQHVAWEGPGLIASEARKRGKEIKVIRMDMGQSLPTPEEVDGLVVMGGPMGVYEDDKYSFLTEECRLIAELVHRQRPVLGVCLGSQLLAKALGAKVFPGHQSEIGFGSVELTAEGGQDPLFAKLDSPLPAFHWHGDTFDLPSGAVLLASSEIYPHQAFRFGKFAYGLQFHVEPNGDTWSRWREHLPPGLLDGAESQRQRIGQAGKNVISNFFDLVKAIDPE